MSQAATAALDIWREIGSEIASPVGWRYHSLWNKNNRNVAGMEDDEDFPDALVRSLVNSPIYSARPDTVALVDATAANVPYHPVLAGDELPSPSGFVVLGEPLSMIDVHGKTMRVHAMQWWPTVVNLRVQGEAATHAKAAAAVAYVAYANADDPLDHYSVELAEQRVVKWPVAHFSLYPADQHTFDWVEGVDTTLSTMISKDLWKDAELVRWILAWWMLVKTQMVEVVDTPAPRAARRRLVRRYGDVRIPEVKVVDLRRRAPSEGPRGRVGAVDWSHRWAVRPHWRRQWYPSVREHRLKLIEGYVKGPENKPLVVRPTVFDVRPPRPSGDV